MDEVPQQANVVMYTLRERQTAPDKPRDSLPESAVKPLYIARSAAALAYHSMPLAGQQASVSFPVIRIDDGALPIDLRQRDPQLLSTLPTAIAYMRANNLSIALIEC